MMEETKDRQQKLLDIATFFINNTTYKNLESQAVVISKLIVLGGDKLRSHLVVQFCRTRALCEYNNLELYAEMIGLIQDEKLCDQIVFESVKVVNEILHANIVNGKVKEKLRSIGTFIGLLTLARDIPILASTADFKRMLVDAMASKNSQRICLMVVLITHLLKYCERSIIFKKDCTWVSRIIALLREIHNADGTDVFVCLEIERFLENLDNPTSTNNKQSFSDESLMNELTRTNDTKESTYHQYDYSSPPNDYTRNYYDENTYDMDMDAEGNPMVPPMSQLPIRPFAIVPPNPQFSMHQQPLHSLNMRSNTPHRAFSQPSTLSDYHSTSDDIYTQAHPFQQLSTPQFPEAFQQRFRASKGSMPEVTNARRELFNSNFPSTQSSYYSSQQRSNSPAYFSGVPNDNNRDGMFIQLLVARLDFCDAPVFFTYPKTRCFIVENFTCILHELGKKFLDRIGSFVDSFCDNILMRDLAFCTDEKQIRQFYLVAIRSLLLAAFQPQPSIDVVMQQFTQSAVNLFKQMLVKIDSPESNQEVQNFLDDYIPTFVGKNQQIVVNCMIIMLNRRAVVITEQKFRDLFASVDRMSMAFPSFVGSSRSEAEINDRLPEPLRRTYGPLNEEELRIYTNYDSMARTLQQFIEQGSGDELDDQSRTNPINRTLFAPFSQDRTDLSHVNTIKESEVRFNFCSAIYNQKA
ncbi:Not1 [Aphelenchoides besseyi]|nr:Not1 [Aphelenchoides besseyi]